MSSPFQTCKVHDVILSSGMRFFEAVLDLHRFWPTQVVNGVLIFEIVSQVLEAVFEMFWKISVFVEADKASNMTGRVQGAITRFQKLCLLIFFYLLACK